MKQIIGFILAVFLPAIVLAEPGYYQPPVPTAQVAVTPGQICAVEAVNQYCEHGVYINSAVQTPIPVSVGSITATEITPIPQVVMNPTALPTLFPVTPNALVNSVALKAVRINNGFNIDIQCSFGAAAATPLPFTVPAGTEDYENFQQQDVKMSSGVSCIHPAASTPSSGTLQVWGYQ